MVNSVGESALPNSEGSRGFLFILSDGCPCVASCVVSFTSFSCRDGDAATRYFPRFLVSVFSSVQDFIVDFFEFVAAPTTETAVSTRDWADCGSHVASCAQQCGD